MKALATILIFSFLFSKNYAQQLEQTLNIFMKKEFDKIENAWNEKGYWGAAFEERDNRYNEAILIYCKMGADSGLNYSKVKKAIKFSFEHLQDPDGGMLQLGKPVHVRTSLFLYGVANVLLEHPMILEENPSIKTGFERAVEYLKDPHPFSSNHNIAAMLVFRMLHQNTCEERFLELYKKYRRVVIGDFKYLGSNKGFWPESEKKWANRLSVPYLFVQSFFLMEYLSFFDDAEIQELFEREVDFMVELIDFNKVSVNVEMSNGNFKRKGIKEVPLSSYSFFNYSRVKESVSLKQRQSILKKTMYMYQKQCDKLPFLAYTDLYFRFGITDKHNQTN